jgi:hypothetical protein
MESSDPQRHNFIDAATLRRLANSVEVLGNIFYLLEMHIHRPERIEHFLGIGKPALEELQDFVYHELRRRQVN